MNTWPKIYKIKQTFSNQPIVKDIEETIAKEVEYVISQSQLLAGSSIAIPAGSRGISNIVIILKTIITKLKEMGYQPFLFSAMGSHGGGISEGQKSILESLGITEDVMKCPVIFSSEVVQLGNTDQEITGLPVYVAKEAVKADGILVVNRIKAHTSFTGTYESGLLKMMAVGMGRAKGASMVHSLGAEYLAKSIPSIAIKAMELAPIIGGIGIVENALEETAMIKGLYKDEILKEEKRLLQIAKSYMPKLPVKDIDLAIILQMGKNYSGTGMDTNVIGRLRIEGVPEPTHTNIRYLAVLDLSEESHGNATGIGLADFTTEKLVRKIDKQATYLNCMTSGFVTRAAIPMTFPDDKTLFEGIEKVLKRDDLSNLKIAIIKNTLQIDELWVSEAIFQTLQGEKNFELLEGPLNIKFDETNSLTLN
ncbi:nickel pincer cofactor-dependent isomerase, group 22 [Tepidibacillus decaturensis]|uniref:LarA-like N-terminal domain-containing protein n=1 Tax=Tepidibacillus decaturensis TaxID=1413211 RepID=A0A135L170_9BACI|nr:lactate racemase domain-containing protein [Tepidibacillus decaturensis]KXG42751.1 hypothetical protein U473_00840 [Tepidibacillus decaturensis]